MPTPSTTSGKTRTAASGAKLDRTHPNYASRLPAEVQTGPQRACWNSWIAPHNFEGFFLNFGDMLVKQGKPGLAREMYGQAKLATSYADWPYRNVIERRIAEADANVARFRAPANRDREHRLLFETGFSCMACHASTLPNGPVP